MYHTDLDFSGEQTLQSDLHVTLLHCSMDILFKSYGLLTKCEVKMAGYWPRTRPISSHLDRTNLVNKGFIIWLSEKCFLRDTAGCPERARWLGSQSHYAIWFILPACRTSHIIKGITE